MVSRGQAWSAEFRCSQMLQLRSGQVRRGKLKSGVVRQGRAWSAKVSYDQQGSGGGSRGQALSAEVFASLSYPVAK